MKRMSLLIFALVCVLFVDSCSDSNDWHAPFSYELLDTDMEKAYTQALDFRERSESNNYLSGLVESNYILGHIHYKKEEYDEAISHNLEAVHYAEKDPQKFADNLVSLYKNCGNIYWKTGSHWLAKESYEKAIRIAEASGNTKQIVSLSFNLSFVYKDRGEHKRSIAVLTRVLALAETGSRKYFDILNNLAARHEGSGEYGSAISILNRLLDELPADDLKKRSYAFHNMARTYKSLGELDLALHWYQKAIDEKKKITTDNPSLFSSLYGMGETYSLKGDLEKAKAYFSEAAPFFTDEMRTDPAYFGLYKAQTDCFTG